MGNAAASPVLSQKQCIACRESIPMDATICSHCSTSQVPAQPERFKSISTWVGTAGAMIGLVASLWAGVHWFEAQQSRRTQARTAMAVSQSQTDLGDYEAAFRTLQGAVANGVASRTLAVGEVDAAMLWVEHFPAFYYESSKDTESDLAKLHEILKVLQSALASNAGARKADVLAHIGWTQWEIADFSEATSDASAYRAALALDPGNPYANAMLGFYLQMTKGDLQESQACFSKALAAGRARPFVRSMQLRSVLRTDGIELRGDRAMLARVVNEMRRNGEELSAQQRRSIVNYAYNPLADGELKEVERKLGRSLSALPEADSWATYKWLIHGMEPSDFVRDLIHAQMVEVSGNKSEALAEYRSLEAREAEAAKAQPLSWLPDQIKDGIGRVK